MSQETRTSRMTKAPKVASGGADTAAPTVMSLFAAGSRAIDLLPRLHRQALDATGGGCSLLFEQNPRSGELHATSGYGLDELRADPLAPGPDEAGLLAQLFMRREPFLVTDIRKQMPDLSVRIGTPNALLLPLAQGDERLGLLAVGFSDAPDLTAIGVESIATADAFVTAIELLRL